MSLIGKWKLVKEGSDFLPGLDTLPDLPLVAKLLGNQDVEFFKIEKRKYMDIEEILFSYSSKSSSFSRSYQLGTVNFESAVGNDVILSCVQNCAEGFNELAVVRLGPKPGQNSREFFQLDRAKDVIKLVIDLTTSEGTVIKMIKFLTRFDSSLTENVPFQLAARSNGWRIHDFWPSTIISSADAKIVKAAKIKFMNSASDEPTRVLEELWSSESIGDVELNTLTRCFAGKSHESGDFVAFFIKVSVDGSSWYVVRRYNEFDALRHFLLTQNPHNTEFQQANGRFPGKALVFRKSVLDARLRGLDEFLSFYLTNARYCRQNALDAICAFLQIPEHSYVKARGSVPSSPPSRVVSVQSQPASVTASSETSTLSTGAVKGSKAPATDSSTSSAPKAAHTGSASPAISVGIKAEKSTPANASFVTSTSANREAPDEKAKPKTSVGTPVVSSPVDSPSTHVNVVVTGKTVPQSSGIVESKLDHDDPDGSLTPAQRRLLNVLGEGMHVIKHGRQGAPKQRLLRCNRQATELFIQADDHRKTLKLTEVESIRLGTEIDPVTSPDAIRSMNETSSDAGKRPSVMRRASMSLRGLNDSTIYYGTSTLRRTCKFDDMRFCVSLIMPDRTFDIQCKTMEDLETLHRVLLEACGKAK